MLRATYLFVFGLVVTFATLACCQETSIDHAMQISQRTGKPIFAIASRKSCGPCQILKSRIAQHLQSSQVANKVVYLNVDLDGPHWNTWSQQFPHQGSMLPVVYLVRADRTKVYGQSNTLQGDQLEKFLTQGVAHCGKSFDESQIATIENSNSMVKQAIKNNQFENAVQWLNGNALLASTQSSNSYAAAVIESKQLRMTVAAKSEAFVSEKIEAISKSLTQKNPDRFRTVYQFVSLEKNFGQGKKAVAHLSKVAVKLAVDQELRQLWSNATQVYEANQTLVASTSVEEKKNAIQILNTLNETASDRQTQLAALHVMRRNAAIVAKLETVSTTK